MKKDELTIRSSSEDDGQTEVILYPKGNYYKFDCIRLRVSELKGSLKEVDMTPDEALDIANLLIKGVEMFFYTNKEHKQWMKRVEKKMDLSKEKELNEQTNSKTKKSN